MVSVVGVRAAYRKLWGGPKPTLEVVDLSLCPGEVHALVGANGAGKTTLLRVILGLLAPISGEVRLLGFDPLRFRARIMPELGVLLDGRRSLEPRLTGLENLIYKAALYRLGPRISQGRAVALLQRFGLPPHEVVNRYSRGMRQRLQLAVAILHMPKLLLLDEPTLGLDIEGMSILGDVMREVASQGGAVLLTSQELSFLERAAHRVTVLDAGKVVACGAPAEVSASLGSATRIRLKVRNPARVVAPLPMGFTWDGEALEGVLELITLEEGVRYLRDSGAGLLDIERVSGLERVLRGSSRG